MSAPRKIATPAAMGSSAAADTAVTSRGPGAVFTRSWVVDMILDLAGYRAEEDLGGGLAIEPACGDGAFVLPMARRLLASAASHGRPVETLGNALRAYDLDKGSVLRTKERLLSLLREHGVRPAASRRLVSAWVSQADFLLDVPTDGKARWLLGNPPYLRIEDVDGATLAAYRERWSAMTGRADVYVGFLQAGIEHLAADGTLAVICADRWMRNQYGAKLRRLISDGLSFTTSLVLHEVNAFEDQVAAYPAVIVIRNQGQGSVLVAEATSSFDASHASHFVTAARRGPAPLASSSGYQASWASSWFSGSGSWPAGSPERLALITDLEDRFQPLDKHSDIKLGVGVATGADDVFLRPAGRLANIEADRVLPYVAGRDLAKKKPPARYLINPWLAHGELVDLKDYPGLAAYLRRHARRLRERHIVKQKPNAPWWRTIDAIDPGLAKRPKLLLPDLKERIEPVLDGDGRYPGHSLCYITSTTWELAVLGGLLLSDIATAFIEAYSVRMANGCLRVSAQYLRRIPLPRHAELSSADRAALARAFADRDRVGASTTARKIYGIA